MTQIDNNAAKPKVPPKKLLLVRFGKMGTLGWFEHNESQIPLTKTHAIIKTSRGLELGQIVGQGNYRGGHFRSTPEQVSDYFGPTETGGPVITETGTFVRFAGHEDLHEQQHLDQSAIAESKVCEKFAREMDLPMKIVDAEHLFGGERIIIYFTSEGRVDFRELVKRLAREYQTRIELRQIGSRDEARLIGDYETCGQECCCKRYLKILAPVNMRMAKLQKATLDPSKISGHCGRLKCCLRYEDENYLELRDKLPKRNAIVNTSQGLGKVIDVQILTQLVVVQYENGERQAWPLEEIGTDGNPAPVKNVQKKEAENADAYEREADELERAESDNQRGRPRDASAPVRKEPVQKGPNSQQDRSSRPDNRPQNQQNQNRNQNNRNQNRNQNKKRFNDRRGKNGNPNPNPNPNPRSDNP